MKALRHVLHGLAAAGLFALMAGSAIAADTFVRGDEKCMACHAAVRTDKIAPIAMTRHGVKGDGRTPSCTSCHGESDSHIASGNGTVKPDRVFKGARADAADALNGACLSCHENKARTQWMGSRHQVDGLACSTCHSVHAAQDPVLAKVSQPQVCFNCHKTERAQTERISHHPIQEGKVACSDCHNPHGGIGPKNLAKSTVNEVCWTCHAEKRGPFLWEHPPATDDCTNCHTPHGSSTTPLLKVRAPWLCQQCHGDGAPHPGNVYSGASLPGGAVANANNTGGVSGSNQLGVINPITGARITQNNPAAQIAFRGCTNCHNAVHGSNHPAGNRFLR